MRHHATWIGALGIALTHAAATAAAQATTPAAAPFITRDSLQAVVDARVATGRTAGIIVGVIAPDDSTFSVAAGSAQPGMPVDERTIFEIGSMTKTLTATLLADMVGRGEVRLDEPVAELLPPGTRVPARNGRQITLGDLSSQLSGLPRLPDNMHPADPANPYADYSVSQLYDFLARYDLPRDPGSKYEYSNLGVGLLGHALALHAGKSYEALLQERVLQPLGMSSTAITLTAAMRARMAEGHDMAGGVVPLWDLPTLAGAGALRSSLQDMMRYLRANLAPPDGALGRAIGLTHVPRFVVNGSLALGLNWHISNFQGDTLIWHNGGTAGFRSMIAMNPRSGAGVVLLTNSASDNEDIVRHILSGTPLVVPVVHVEIPVAPDSLARYVGVYQLGPQFSIEITRDGGHLYAQATAQPRFPIFAETPNRFFYKVVEAQLEFERDSSGAVTGLTLIQNGGRAPASKIR